MHSVLMSEPVVEEKPAAQSSSSTSVCEGVLPCHLWFRRYQFFLHSLLRLIFVCGVVALLAADFAKITDAVHRLGSVLLIVENSAGSPQRLVRDYVLDPTTIGTGDELTAADQIVSLSSAGTVRRNFHVSLRLLGNKSSDSESRGGARSNTMYHFNGLEMEIRFSPCSGVDLCCAALHDAATGVVMKLPAPLEGIASCPTVAKAVNNVIVALLLASDATVTAIVLVASDTAFVEVQRESVAKLFSSSLATFDIIAVPPGHLSSQFVLVISTQFALTVARLQFEEQPSTSSVVAFSGNGQALLRYAIGATIPLGGATVAVGGSVFLPSSGSILVLLESSEASWHVVHSKLPGAFLPRFGLLKISVFNFLASAVLPLPAHTDDGVAVEMATTDALLLLPSVAGLDSAELDVHGVRYEITWHGGYTLVGICDALTSGASASVTVWGPRVIDLPSTTLIPGSGLVVAPYSRGLLSTDVVNYDSLSTHLGGLLLGRVLDPNSLFVQALW